METIADRYQRLAGAFATTLAAVPSDAWANQSPCPDWTALDVARHVVDSQNLFFGLVGKPPVSAPTVDDDPVAAWATTSAAVLADLRDPVASTIRFDGFFGPTTFEDAVDRFLCFDLVVHRWDLGIAAGIAVEITDDDLEMVEQGMARFGDAMRVPGAFGEALEPPTGADHQTAVLAFLGRRA